MAHRRPRRVGRTQPAGEGHFHGRCGGLTRSLLAVFRHGPRAEAGYLENVPFDVVIGMPARTEFFSRMSSTLKVVDADLEDPALAEFLRAHLADIAPTGPAESQHALDLDALRGNGIRVWAAVDTKHGRDVAPLVGVVALAPLDDGCEELKSMRTDPACRRRGIASIMLTHALDDAARRQVPAIRLETGSMDFFAPARALYRKFGFVDRGPFGSYPPDPNSVHMELPLANWTAARQM